MCRETRNVFPISLLKLNNRGVLLNEPHRSLRCMLGWRDDGSTAPKVLSDAWKMSTASYSMSAAIRNRFAKAMCSVAEVTLPIHKKRGL